MEEFAENGLAPESLPAFATLAKNLSLTVQRLERASDIGEKREHQIREEERHRTLRHFESSPGTHSIGRVYPPEILPAPAVLPVAFPVPKIQPCMLD